MNIIEIENLSYEYVLPQDSDAADSGEKRLRVLNGINLSFERGTFTAVLGANGSGKSTLAKLLNGILIPTAGKVFVNGIDTADERRVYDVRQSVGMVFQNPDNQIVSAVVEEDVAFALENLGVAPSDIRARIDEAMRTVDIYHLRKSAPHLLSGGQKQRVAIAGVIAMAPGCIVLDEPTAMLDPAGRAEVLSTARRLCREQGITIIYITHYMEEAATADRVVVMSRGSVVMDGKPAGVFSQVERVRALELDVPQVTELIHSLKGQIKDDKLSGIIITEEACADELTALFERRGVPKNRGVLKKAAEISAVNKSGISAVEFSHVSHIYGTGTPYQHTAIDDISFTIDEGEFIGIIGHTGSGKSTLIQHINGLLKPSSGEIRLFSKNIWEKDKKKRGKGAKEPPALQTVRFTAGLVFQYSEYQLFEETVYKDIAFGPKNMGLTEKEIKQRVLQAADAMGVERSWLERSPFDLSGGEKRRVALAGVIAMQPRVLILDEPAAGLDPHGRESILEHINRLHKDADGKLTILLISHSMEDIVRFAGRIIVMNGGKVAFFEPTPNVFSDAGRLTDMKLSLPQTARLAERLRKAGYPLPGGAYTVSSALDSIKSLLGV